jgi:hypothetical protein
MDGGIGSMSKMRLFLLSLLVVLGVSAVASASTSALIWVACIRTTFGTGSNKFLTLSQCQEGSGFAMGEWELVSLPEGVRSEIETNGGPLTLKGELAGAEIEIKAEKEKGLGWIENPVGGGNGLDLDTSELTKVTVLKPAASGCTVKEPLIWKAKGEAITVGGVIYDKFSPDSGTSFASVVLENCTPSTLNGTYPIKGEAYALVVNKTSSFTYDSGAPNNKLKFGGNPAEFTGSTKVAFKGSEGGL